MRRAMAVAREWLIGWIVVAATVWAQPAAASDVRFVGSVGYSHLVNIVLLHADQLQNFSTTTSAALRMELWATPSPFTGSFAGGIQLATYGVGALAAGASVTSVNSGTVPWNEPPVAWWYVTMVLTEQAGAGGNDGYVPRNWLGFPDKILGNGSGTPPADTTPPTASISAPTGGNVSGTVTISANASDNIGVARVDFYVNGSLVGSDSSAPYAYAWNTTALANGGATLRAVAFDAAGNSGQSALVTVTVANVVTPPPDTTPPTASITSPTGGSVAGTVTVSANASDNVGVARVDFYVNGGLVGSDSAAPYTYAWNTTTLANGSATLRAVAFDAAGNSGQSAFVTVNVANVVAPPPDTTPPTVSIASPTGGSVAGTVTISANANDNVGVTRVDFLVNGQLVNTDTTAPWQFSWNSGSLPNGTVQLSAKAYDAAGNSATSTPVSVTVSNTAPPLPGDTIAPTVSITSPTSGQVSKNVQVSIQANDNVGVTRVDLIVNGQVVGSDTASPWRINWNTSGTAGTVATLQAVAYDAAGNAGASAPVVVTVSNQTGPRPKTANAVEYYNAELDHYFVTASETEIQALDAGRLTGWTRTGATFGLYAEGGGSDSPVCRIYLPPGYGDSHFFSASPDECADVIRKFPQFMLETASAFYVYEPDVVTGACPDGMLPVYRVWNQRADTNHRYTTSAEVRDEMVARGYVAEGYGPNSVIMCSPQ